jgi:zinc transport system substrate-binding protein
MKLLTILLPLISFSLTISATIMPQKYIIQEIAKEKVEINIMVPPGISPVIYSLKLNQLKKIKNSQVYFTIGVPFDKKFISKIKEINPKIEIIDFNKYIKTTSNPHTWLSPALLMLQAKVVLDTLIEKDPKNKDFYIHNYTQLISKLTLLESKGLKEINQKAFLTFHPSFYYFAKDFHLKELAIQKEGKDPSFSYISKILKKAKELNIKTVIISPEFPKKYAKIIANKIGAKVVIISPLNNPLTTIKKLIKALK